MAMTRTREDAADRLLMRLEHALFERMEARNDFANLPAGVGDSTFNEYARRKRAAEVRATMLRGTTWRALVNSTEEL